MKSSTRGFIKIPSLNFVETLGLVIAVLALIFFFIEARADATKDNLTTKIEALSNTLTTKIEALSKEFELTKKEFELIKNEISENNKRVLEDNKKVLESNEKVVQDFQIALKRLIDLEKQKNK